MLSNSYNVHFQQIWSPKEISQHFTPRNSQAVLRLVTLKLHASPCASGGGQQRDLPSFLLLIWDFKGICLFLC